MGSEMRGKLVISLGAMLTAAPVAMSQFVTLEGRRFMLNGQEFYPIAMNFIVQNVHTDPTAQPTNPLSVFPAVDYSWDLDYGYECSDETSCHQQLRTAFQKVRAMGFNTLRLVGGAIVPSYQSRPDIGATQRRFVFEVSKLTDPAIRNPIIMSQDFTDVWSIRHFQNLIAVLDAAADEDLKVILLAGGGSRLNSSLTGSTDMYPSFDEDAVDDYASYLGKLAEELSGHPALLAYDLCNEPHYHHWDRVGYDGIAPHDEPHWTKADVCAFTTQWYDVIHAHDPQHLVTIGGADLDDLRTWDPGTMKIDFFSLHTYPQPGFYPEPPPPLPPLAQGPLLDRHHGRLHAFGQLCKIPWIIGETGFSANDLAHPQYPWPYMHGTEAEQADYIALSLDKARSCGASGWSWWIFQDFRWYDPANSTAQEARENYYGMLRLGNGSTSWTDKQGVAVVQQYSPGEAPPTPDQPPANYLNPYLHPPNPGVVWYQGGNPFYGTLSGQVIDQHGAPIAGAWVRGDGYIGINQQTQDLLYYAHDTYTDEQGYFELRGFDPAPGNRAHVGDFAEISDRTINSLWIHAFASRSTYRGNQWVPYSYTLIQPQATYELHSLQRRYDEVLNNEVVWWGEEREYTALASLTALNVTVGGTATLKAPLAVNLRPGFDAVLGSEMHAYTEPVHLDCAEVQGAAMMAPVPDGAAGVMPPVTDPKSASSEVELVFHASPTKKQVEIFPNPGRQFQVRLQGTLSRTPMGRLEVWSGAGDLVWTQGITDQVTMLDMSDAASGQYILHIQWGSLNATHQLIVP